ncbi:putative uncharacterized protein DDB_G0280331 [Drosophila mojavensis]|uniref:Uncharacterized protein n=1 Tax=Drosophila mojavensis TaxID=7230 RepID=A0A0Q9WZK2_DROMO|nr:putative uncharacterized protein DDB_G0280331 [Drosophila mojavensis]KRF93914.1 uncharacterized protein Dmoj_GI26831 [Drosophila mojavensis]
MRKLRPWTRALLSPAPKVIDASNASAMRSTNTTGNNNSQHNNNSNSSFNNNNNNSNNSDR